VRMARAGVFGMALMIALGATRNAWAGSDDLLWSWDKGLHYHVPHTPIDLRAGGLVMFDGGVQWRDEGTSAATKLRRARVNLGAGFGEHIRAWAAFEFADGTARLNEGYLRFDPNEHLSLRVGHFQQAFGLEHTTSSRFTTFVERGLPEVLTPGRRLGLELAGHGRHWSATGALTRGSLANGGFGWLDTGWGGVGRVTFAPIASERRVLHFGASGSWSDELDGRVRYRVWPESMVFSNLLLDSGTIRHIGSGASIGAEVAAVLGPFSVQAEFVQSLLDRTQGRDDYDPRGFYALASWFVTGESRPYDPGNGTFQGIVPRSRWGAVELAVRASAIDLDDGLLQRGRGRDLSFGVNWYVDRRVRVMADLVRAHSEIDKQDTDSTLLSMRLQLDF